MAHSRTTVEKLRDGTAGCAVFKVTATRGRGAKATPIGHVEVSLPTRKATWEEFQAAMGGEARVRSLAISQRLVEIRAKIAAGLKKSARKAATTGLD